MLNQLTPTDVRNKMMALKIRCSKVTVSIGNTELIPSKNKIAAVVSYVILNLLLPTID